MHADDWSIEVFDPSSASQQDLVLANTFLNRMQAERLPREPATPLEVTILDLQNVPPEVDLRLWAVRRPNSPEFIASGRAAFLRTEDNRHLGEARIDVLPEFRRSGIGTALLSRIVEAARTEGRRLLIGMTWDGAPDGEAFALRLGCQSAMSGHVIQLELGELDRGLLQRWQDDRLQRAGDLKLEFWDGPPYPEDQIETVVAMHEANNLMPFGDLDVEDFHVGPEQVRQRDQSLLAQGIRRWTMVVRDPENQEFAGYTEVFWNPHKPDVIEQGGTAVLPAYQNRGIGRWLKAAMLEKVLRDRPEVTRVQTGNADSNAPMLHINLELGFKPYTATMYWQIELDLAQEYLAASATANTPTPVPR
jgi:mycothiol synthase